MKTNKENLELIEDFYSLYLRSPRYNEFIAIGGEMKRTRYMAFLIENYFDEYKAREETREVYDVRGKVIFTGTIKDIANEFDIKTNYLRNAEKKKNTLKRQYWIRKKPFDLEYFKKHRKDV